MPWYLRHVWPHDVDYRIAELNSKVLVYRNEYVTSGNSPCVIGWLLPSYGILNRSMLASTNYGSTISMYRPQILLETHYTHDCNACISMNIFTVYRVSGLRAVSITLGTGLFKFIELSPCRCICLSWWDKFVCVFSSSWLYSTHC